MSFGLLAPLFLAGLAAVAIPIVVHLVRREEQMSFAFPSLMFLKRIPVREHRRRTIRHWWLLALRCLIIALLCLAFARPFINFPSASVASLVDGRDRVVLLDRSHSMRLGSRWDTASDIALEAIGELGGGDRGALIVFDHNTLVSQELTADHVSLRALVAGTKPGDGHTDLVGAVARANALLEKSDAAKREIVLISDFQRTGVNGQAHVAPGIDIIPHAVTGPDKANAGIAGVKLRRAPLGVGDAVELEARIVNSGVLPIESADLAMEVDGQYRDRRIVSLAGGESLDAVFRLVLAPDELLQVRIHLGDDALEADNSFHLVVSGRAVVPVLLVQDRNAPPGSALHLVHALGQGGAPGFRVTLRTVSELREADFDSVDVVIIDDAPVPGGSVGQRLHRFLHSGGGMLVATGGRTKGNWPGGEDGIVPGRLGPSVARARSDTGRLLGINRLHPALAGFAGIEDGDLASAQVFSYRSLTGVDQGAVLARYDDDRVALAEREVGRGRALVLTTTLGPSWNNLALQPGFVPLVHETLKYLASHVPTTESVIVGDTVDIATYARGLPGHTRSAAALARGTVTTLRTPSGQKMHMPPGEAFAQIAEAGFHEVHVSGGGTRSIVIAANPSSRESNLEPMSIEAFIDSIGVKDGGGTTRQTSAARSALSGVDQRGWWYLLLACGLLLLLETLLSNRLSQSAGTS